MREDEEETIDDLENDGTNLDSTPDTETQE